MRLKLKFTSVFFRRRVRRGGEERHASKRKRSPRWEDPVTVKSLPALINGIPTCYVKGATHMADPVYKEVELYRMADVPVCQRWVSTAPSFTKCKKGNFT